MGPKFGKTLTLIRPVLTSTGNLTFPAGSSVKGALWRMRRRGSAPGQGDISIVDARAFLPAGTDVRLDDRIVDGSNRYRVTWAMDGEDDSGTIDHIGVELKAVDGET